MSETTNNIFSDSDSNNYPIKIVIADDHILFSQGISAVINTRPGMSVTATFLNGKELLNWYNGENADIILLDMRMPVMDGTETCRQLLVRNPSVKIIVLSAFSKPAEIRYMFNLGIYAYLLKDIDANILVQTLLRVHADERLLPETVFFTPRQRVAKIKIPIEVLSARELQVLKLLSKGKSNKEISIELNISELTIKTHRQNILRKMGSANMVQLILNAGFKGRL